MSHQEYPMGVLRLQRVWRDEPIQVDPSTTNRNGKELQK